MLYDWIDDKIFPNHSYVKGAKEGIRLMEVSYTSSRWIIKVLGASIERVGRSDEMSFAKGVAEGQLSMFMGKYGFHLNDLKIPGTTSTFRRGRRGLLWELKTMLLLLRRVFKQVEEQYYTASPLRFKKVSVEFDYNLMHQLHGYLYAKDAHIQRTNRRRRIVWLGKNHKIKNVDWRQLLEKLESEDRLYDGQ